MNLAKTANDSIPFSVFYHNLKFRTLNFDGAYLLRKTFGTLGFLFTITRLDVYYHPLKLLPSFMKHPVYVQSVKKKSNTRIHSNTNYRIEMKLVPIIMDYCLLQLDALKFFFGLSLHGGGLCLTLIFSM